MNMEQEQLKKDERYMQMALAEARQAYAQGEIPIGACPFTLSDNRKWRHWHLTTELRWWPHQAFDGFFLGLHAGGGDVTTATNQLSVTLGRMI